MKGEPRCYAVAMSDLNEIARGESDASRRFKNEEAVKGSLRSAYRNRIGG